MDFLTEYNRKMQVTRKEIHFLGKKDV